MPALKFIAVSLALCVTIGCGDQPAATPTNGITPSSPTLVDLHVVDPKPDGELWPAWAGQSPSEPFDVNEFLRNRVVPDDNAAPLYVEALRRISGAWEDSQGVSFEERIRQAGDVDRLTGSEVSDSEIAAILAAVSPAIDQVEAAQAMPTCVFVAGLASDAGFPHALAARTWTRLCVMRIANGVARADHDEIASALRQGLRLSRDLQPKGPFVCQLVSISCDEMLLEGVQRLVLNHKHLTPGLCDQLLALLVQHEQESLDRYDEGLRMDYLLARASIHDLQSGRLTLGQIIENLQGLSDGQPVLTGDVPMNYAAEIAATNRLYNIVLTAHASRPNAADELVEFQAERAKLQQEFQSFLDSLERIPPARRVSQISTMPAMQVGTWTASIEPGRESCLRAAANLAGVKMLVALRRFELAHRHWPSALSEATAESILKTVPTDPFSGQPLRHTMIGDRMIVYSVGKDRKNDDGRVDWTHGTTPGDYLFELNPWRSGHNPSDEPTNESPHSR